MQSIYLIEIMGFVGLIGLVCFLFIIGISTFSPKVNVIAWLQFKLV